MKKRTAYLISGTHFEYDDNGYDVTDGAVPDSVYFDKDAAKNKCKELSREFCLNNHHIGEYCMSIDSADANKLITEFPDVFDKWGQLKYTGSDWKDRVYAAITPEIADYIADRFTFFTVQEIEVYE